MTTPLFELEEWAEAQAQPHATVNEDLRILEALSQLIVIDRDLTAPPGSPADGDCYIPASGATGLWAAHENDIAIYVGSAWVFRQPRNGWRAYVEDEDIDVRFSADSPGGWDPV